MFKLLERLILVFIVSMCGIFIGKTYFDDLHKKVEKIDNRTQAMQIKLDAFVNDIETGKIYFQIKE